jgi:hypothetical protein
MPRGLRLRVFAGPNGSGKSTIINEVRSVRVDGRAIDLGVYINADDLARELEQGITLTQYGIELSQNDLLAFSERSVFLAPISTSRNYCDPLLGRMGVFVRSVVLVEIDWHSCSHNISTRLFYLTARSTRLKQSSAIGASWN